MDHPYEDLIGYRVTVRGAGTCRLEIDVRRDLMNPHGVVHGAVHYALADTGMGSAAYTVLKPGESCATVNCSISYFRPVTEGTIICDTHVTNRGRTVITLESEIRNGDRLVAKALGQFSVILPRKP